MTATELSASNSIPRAFVIGAGTIGINCATAPQSRGFAVTIADDRPRQKDASAGNAECFAASEIEPISMPGLVWRVPPILADPFGPLTIRWSRVLSTAPRCWSFRRAVRDIGRTSRHPSVILAFVHAHLWLTLGATTGRLVAELACDEPSPAERRRFSPERF